LWEKSLFYILSIQSENPSMLSQQGAERSTIMHRDLENSTPDWYKSTQKAQKSGREYIRGRLSAF